MNSPEALSTPPGVRSERGVVLLSNTDPALRRCWHPVALVDEVAAGPVDVQLLGETWKVDPDLAAPSGVRRQAADSPSIEHLDADLRAEVHIKADAATIGLRRILAGLVAEAG